MEKNVKANNATVNCNNCKVNIYLNGDSIKVNADKTSEIREHVFAGASHVAHMNEVSARIREALKGDDEALHYIESIIVTNISDGGYMDVDGIVRRWIPSQCLKMYYSREGFHTSLKYMGYDYTWKVLVNDLKVQRRLWKMGDDKGLADRSRWYNKELVIKMATDLYNELVETVNKAHRHSCKGRSYVNIRVRDINNQKGLFEDELDAFFKHIEKLIECVGIARNPIELYDAAQKIMRFVHKFSNWRPKKQSKAFQNAYKAAGAYYTIKDLILFEGCKMVSYDKYYYVKGLLSSQEESLDALEGKVNDLVKRGVVFDEGYTVLSLLGDVLKWNKFDFEAAKREWGKMYEARK